MKLTRKAATVLAAVGLLAAAGACSSGTPTKATTDTTPNFQGSYTGSSSVSGCVEDGGFSGFCTGVGFVNGVTFPTTLSLTQTQSAVTGTITILGLNGTLTGTASGVTGLTASGTLQDASNGGVTLNPTITAWSTTLSGNSLSGSYKIVFKSSAVTGSSTVTANIVQLSR